MSRAASAAGTLENHRSIIMATIIGTPGPDTRVGTPLNDSISGLGGNDRLFGRAGNDTMVSGGGNDQVFGESGNDKLFGDAGNDRLFGGAGNDRLFGGAGNDLLDGGSGGDAMVGGTGHDTYVVGAGDTYTEAAGAGLDRVLSSVTHSLRANTEILSLTGTSAINGFGNTLNNTISGNNGSNTLGGANGKDVLNGLNGNDILSGGAGNDVLTGGLGRDTMNGGTGSDRYVFTSLAESAFGANHDVLVYNRAEHDRIDLSRIDANSLVAGDQAFSFRGLGAFNGNAGELRYDIDDVPGQTVIECDVNGDKVADIQIGVEGKVFFGLSNDEFFF
jgi:Ca2+-binding RTX toxin-like protein